MPDRCLELFGYVSVKFDMWRVAPKQVGRDGEIALVGPMVAFATDALIHPEDFLHHDDCTAWRSLGLGDMGVKLPISFQGRN